MPSSLFPQQSNPLLNAVSQIKSLANGNPQVLFDRMMQSNPQFRSFAQSVQGKTPEQAFKDYGLDFNQVRQLLK